VITIVPETVTATRKNKSSQFQGTRRSSGTCESVRPRYSGMMDDSRLDPGDSGAGSGGSAGSDCGKLLLSRVMRERCCSSSFTILHSPLSENLRTFMVKSAGKACRASATAPASAYLLRRLRHWNWCRFRSARGLGFVRCRIFSRGRLVRASLARRSGRLPRRLRDRDL
jgi:hypothetical protein